MIKFKLYDEGDLKTFLTIIRKEKFFLDDLAFEANVSKDILRKYVINPKRVKLGDVIDISKAIERVARRFDYSLDTHPEI